MNIHKTTFTLLISLLLFSGCASNKYAVTIDSNPTGAEVSCNGHSYGYAPITRYFELDEATKKSGYLRTCQWMLRWVSGATATVNNVYDLNKFPNGVIWTTPRPNIEGYSQDAEFALKVKNMQYQSRQATAAEANARANKEAADDAFYQGLQRQNNKSTNCYRMMDGTLFCY